MADKSIEEKVKDIIVEQLGVNPEQVTPQASFIEDLGADSLDIGVRGGIFGGSARRRRREIADRRRCHQIHPGAGEAEGIDDWVRRSPSRPAKQQANLGGSAAGASSGSRFWLRRAIGITV